MNLLLLILTALAAQLRIEPAVRELKVGQSVVVEIALINGRAAGRPTVTVPEGLSVQYQGSSQSVTQVNLQTTRIVRYQYMLTGLAEGDWRLGPAMIEVDGQSVSASPVTISVTARTAAESQQTSVVGTISDSEPFVGEVEIYRFQYRHRQQVYDLRWTPPEYDGFVEARDAESQQREYAMLEDGVEVSVQEVFVPLIAMQAGEHTVTPALLTAQVPTADPRRRRGNDPLFDSIFGRNTATRSETWSTQPIAVRIRPVPEAGQPTDYSGLVGRFSLSVTTSAARIRLGDSITMEITLSGDGQLAGYRLPLPAQDGFRAYDDAAEYDAAVSDGRYRAMATFRRALVPEQEGALVIPPVEIPVFDPEAERYVTLRSDPISLDVLPGESGGGEVTSFSAGTTARPVEALGDDILPPPGDATIADRSLRAALPWLVGAPMIPALLLLGVWVRGRRTGPDPHQERRARLAQLPADPAARLAALEDIFRQEAAARLGTAAPGLTAEQVIPLGEVAVGIYADLSRARYGGEASADLASRVREFVEAL